MGIKDIGVLKGEDAQEPTVRVKVYPRFDYWNAIQKMANRMAFSEQKYGSLEKNYPTPKDSMRTALERIDLYWETGNTEWLLDAANQLIIEFLLPSVAGAHFRATEAHESPGLKERD